MDDHRKSDERDESPIPFVWPPWVELALKGFPVVAALGGVAAVFVVWFWFSPKHYEVGYAPKQPVAFSHKQHAGNLGIDCLYCHNTVDKSWLAAVPPTQTCMNCHTVVKYDSPKLEPVRQSWQTGSVIPWVKVHDVADFAYFDHSRHLNKGVGCVECHGRVDQMEVVRVTQPLSMSWCLDCHRNPAPHLRPREEVTNLAWQPPGGDRLALGQQLVEQYKVAPPVESCGGCHR